VIDRASSLGPRAVALTRATLIIAPRRGPDTERDGSLVRPEVDRGDMGPSHSTAPAGWCVDSLDGTRLRWWDGSAGTEHVAPGPATAPTAFPAAPTSLTPASPALAMSTSGTSRHTSEPAGPLLRLFDLPFRLSKKTFRRSEDMRRLSAGSRSRGPLAGMFESSMSGPAPTFAGSYPDPESGGTKFWDGSRWTGDSRPRRKPFAAPASYRRGRRRRRPRRHPPGVEPVRGATERREHADRRSLPRPAPARTRRGRSGCLPAAGSGADDDVGRGSRCR
jgi:hypothetical protein